MASGRKDRPNDGCQQHRQLPQFLDLDSSAHMEKPIDVPVTGSVPKWLRGSLYRNGNGIFKVGSTTWNHLFDGFAVLHRWTINDGRVSYLSTILDSEQYKKCVKYNRVIGMAFGSNFPDPCKTLFGRFFSYFFPGDLGKRDNTAISVVEYEDRLFALTETSIINEIKPENMLVKDQINMSKVLALHMGTAHPHFEKDGTAYYYGTNMNSKKAYNFVRIPPPKSGESAPFTGAEIIGSVASRWRMNIAYTHSFGMTENYFVHFEQPLALNLPSLMTLNLTGSSVSDCIQEHHDKPIDIHLISKSTGKKVPLRFQAPHGFVFHFVNCYEESCHVVCDVCLYLKRNVYKDLYLKCWLSPEEQKIDSHLVRFVLPLSVDKAEAGQNLVTLPGSKATAVLRKGTRDALDVTCDFMFGDTYLVEVPRINYDFNARKYRYTYGSTVFNRATRRVMKFDVQERTVKEWSCGQDHLPGEPVFVPSPGATKEDDGIVLCPVIAESTEHSSFLLILDAASFTEIGRATTPAQLKMNLTFHGCFTNKVF